MEEKNYPYKYSWGPLYETLTEMPDDHGDPLFKKAFQIFKELDNAKTYKEIHKIVHKTKFTEYELNRINSSCFDGIRHYYWSSVDHTIIYDISERFSLDAFKFFLSKIYPNMQEIETLLKALFKHSCKCNNTNILKFIITIIDKNIVKFDLREIYPDLKEQTIEFLLATYEDYTVEQFLRQAVYDHNVDLVIFLVDEKGADVDSAIISVIYSSDDDWNLKRKNRDIFMFLIHKGVNIDLKTLAFACVNENINLCAPNNYTEEFLNRIFQNREKDLLSYIFYNDFKYYTNTRTNILKKLLPRLGWTFIEQLREFFPDLITRCILLDDYICIDMLLTEGYYDSYSNATNTIWTTIVERRKYDALKLLVRHNISIPENFMSKVLGMLVLKLL